MRATTLLNRVLNLAGVRVINVDPGTDATGPVLVRVASKARKRLSCPHCSFTTMAGYDTRWTESSWRHLDFSGQVQGSGHGEVWLWGICLFLGVFGVSSSCFHALNGR